MSHPKPSPCSCLPGKCYKADALKLGIGCQRLSEDSPPADAPVRRVVEDGITITGPYA